MKGQHLVGDGRLMMPAQHQKKERRKKHCLAKSVKIFSIGFYEQNSALNSKYGTDQTQKVASGGANS